MQYRRKMLTARIPKKKLRRGSTLQPVLPLIPEVLPSQDEDKARFIALDVKVRAGGPNESKYKKYVRKFEEGTPQQWVDLLNDLNEIWRQNSVNGGADRMSTVRAVLRGDSLDAFNTALDDLRNPEGALAPLAVEPEMVQAALDAVTQTVFPHRALEIQKLWMTRGLIKPFSLSTRKTASAITRLNNALPMFPGGSEESKFTPKNVVEILEWSLPEEWRAKFDLDGYIPSEHNKERLIAECEAIERHQEASKEDSKSSKIDVKKSGKSSSNPRKSETRKEYFCRKHGKNVSHDTKDCRDLKRSDNGNSDRSSSNSNNRSFSNRAARKEINLLARGSSKRKVLDQYSAFISRERAKLEKVEKAKKKQKKETSKDVSSDSESDESVQLIDKPVTKSKKTTSSKNAKKRKVQFTEQTEEEKAFLKQIQAEAESEDNSSD